MTGEPPASELPAPRLAAPPELSHSLRVASSAYCAEFGCLPATIWQVPGTVTLLADGPLRLTVAAPWGAIAAAGPREDDTLELVTMERPGERERLTARQAAAGHGPAWAGTGLRAARGGAALLVKSELPEGAGTGLAAATQAAIRHCLADVQAPDTVMGGTAASEPGLPGGCAVLGERLLPFDLAAAGLRLVLIDTRIRGVPQRPPAERSPAAMSLVAMAARALHAGDAAAIGPLLTAAHDALASDARACGALACDRAQDAAVRAALRAGALGARMITDGSGRPACSLVPVGRLAALRAGVAAEFARQGLRPPRLLTFTPARGPHRAFPADPDLTG